MQLIDVDTIPCGSMRSIKSQQVTQKIFQNSYIDNKRTHKIASDIMQAAAAGKSVEMENFFSRLTLDIIGKAVFNYDFDSLTHDDPVIQVRGSADFDLSFQFLACLAEMARMGSE